MWWCQHPPVYGMTLQGTHKWWCQRPTQPWHHRHHQICVQINLPGGSNEGIIEIESIMQQLYGTGRSKRVTHPHQHKSQKSNQHNEPL